MTARMKNEDDGQPERMIPQNQQMTRELEEPPRFGLPGTFEHEFGNRWKELFHMEKVHREQLEQELRESREQLEADMDVAFQDYQAMLMHEDLRHRQEELDRLDAARKEKMLDHLKTFHHNRELVRETKAKKLRSESRRGSIREKQVLGVQQQSRGGNGTIECYECGKQGHTRRNCPAFKCFGCGGVGHMKRVCPTMNKKSETTTAKREETATKAVAFAARVVDQRCSNNTREADVDVSDDEESDEEESESEVTVDVQERERIEEKRWFKENEKLKEKVLELEKVVQLMKWKLEEMGVCERDGDEERDADEEGVEDEGREVKMGMVRKDDDRCQIETEDANFMSKSTMSFLRDYKFRGSMSGPEQSMSDSEQSEQQQKSLKQKKATRKKKKKQKKSTEGISF